MPEAMDFSNPWWWVGQSLGVIAGALLLYSSWTISRKRTVVSNIAAAAFFAVSDVVLGAWGAVVCSVINFVRGIVVERWKVNSERARWAITGFFVAAIWTGYLLVNGWPDNGFEWLPIIGCGLIVIGLGIHDVLIVKWMIFAGSIAWIIYKVWFGLWGVLPGEVAATVLLLPSIVRITRRRKAGLPDVDEETAAASTENPSERISKKVSGSGN